MRVVTLRRYAGWTLVGLAVAITLASLIAALKGGGSFALGPWLVSVKSWRILRISVVLAIAGYAALPNRLEQWTRLSSWAARHERLLTRAALAAATLYLC